MKYIGRRLILDWGDRIVAIEKLLIQPETLGLSHETPGKLYDLYLVDGEIIYKPLGKPYNCSPGRTVDQYMDRYAWLTDEEVAAETAREKS